MFKCTIPEWRHGSAKAEFVPAYKPRADSLFAVHRSGQSWTVALAHSPGPAGSLIPPTFKRTRDGLLRLVAFVEAACPEEVALWRNMDGREAMVHGLTPAQAAAGNNMRLAAYRIAAEL